ncbi:MAG: hypothetical protein JXA71_06570, partial [Chitinispirillaceae bacterium]|nr:hypothetical protein [Chitinispirillaceae bacterium]
MIIRWSNAIILALVTVTAPLAGDDPAGPVIVISGSGIDTCHCAKELFPCHLLRKRVRQPGVQNGPALLRNMLDSLGFFTTR